MAGGPNQSSLMGFKNMSTEGCVEYFFVCVFAPSRLVDFKERITEMKISRIRDTPNLLILGDFGRLGGGLGVELFNFFCLCPPHVCMAAADSGVALLELNVQWD